MRIRNVFGLAAGLVLGFIAPLAFAQGAYPSKPVRLIAPFPPGGSTDVLCRILAQKLGDSLGKQVIVDNRAGAAGNIGHEAGAKAANDGYTLLMSNNSTLTINPHLYKRLPFDPLADFAPISLVATSGQVLVVHPSLPVTNVSRLIALAKSRPGQINFGSGGVGIQSHISGEMFKSMAGVSIVHVPYKGGILAVTDVVAGQIHMMFADMVPAIPQIKAGKLKALAVTDAQRSPTLPGVPTMVEAGVPGYLAQLWWAVLAPKGTSADILNRLNGELARIVKLPDIQERYKDLGITIAHSTPQQVSDLIAVDTQKMAKILKAAGVQPE